jgi:hypothetical protein
MTNHRKRLPDQRRRWNYDPENYQVTGWLLIIVIASFVAVVLLKWFWI